MLCGIGNPPQYHREDKPTFVRRNGPTTLVSYTSIMSCLLVSDNDPKMDGLVIAALLIRRFNPPAPICLLTAWTADEILSSSEMSADRHGHTCTQPHAKRIYISMLSNFREIECKEIVLGSLRGTLCRYDQSDHHKWNQ